MKRQRIPRPDPPLDAATVRRFAVRASTCEETILKVAVGLPVRGLAGHRARAALLAAGYPLPGGDR